VGGVDDGHAPYLNGEYFAKNQGWHVEESSWKAKQVQRMIQRNHLSPKTICDVGCGAGEVLRQLQDSLGSKPLFRGYDISPQAIELASTRANERLQFKLVDFFEEKNGHSDLILVLDVIEHLEDYFGFLRRLKTRGEYKIFHLPLDLSVQAVLREGALTKRREMYNHLHFFTKATALRFFLLIPPSLDVQDASDEIQAAAARQGILVVLPFQHAEPPENAFMDGSHLNSKGAALFTERLGPSLLQSLYRKLGRQSFCPFPAS
jgi:SAM-dependent methyltransferase